MCRRIIGPCSLALGLLLLGLLSGTSVAETDQDPYKVLGVRKSATQREITQAYRRLSRQWHPDKNPGADATQRFQEISAAYERLADPKKAMAGASNLDAGIMTAQSALHMALDLDPLRVWQLGSFWLQGHAAKHWDQFGPLWHGSMDKAACWCLENAWKLPGLAEPMNSWLAKMQVADHRQGQWQAWTTVGILMELGAWAGKQAPCLMHHQRSSSGSSRPAGAQEQLLGQFAGQEHLRAKEEAALQRLKQQLQAQRHARQQVLRRLNHYQQQQKQKVGRNSNMAGGSSMWDTERNAVFAEGKEETGDLSASSNLPTGRQMQACVVWVVLLVGVAYLMLHDRLLLAVAAAAVVAAWMAISGGLIPSESAVQQLAATMEMDSIQASMVGLSFLVVSLSVGLLLPVLLGWAVTLVYSMAWTALWCFKIGMAPATSQMSLAVLIALKVYGLVAGGDVMRGILVLLGFGYLLFKSPRILLWWLSLFMAPLMLLMHFSKEVLHSCGLWWPRLDPGKAYKQAAKPASTEPAAAVAAFVATEAAAGGDAAKDDSRGCVSKVPMTANVEHKPACPDSGKLGSLQQQPSSRVHDGYDCEVTVQGHARFSSKDIPHLQEQEQQQQAQGQLDQEHGCDEPTQHFASTGSSLGPSCSPSSNSNSGSNGCDNGGSSGTTDKGSSGKQAVQSRRLLPDGPWWPRNFGPAALAETCHWYASLVGWHLAKRVLAAALVSCKVTVVMALFGITAAAFGVPVSWFTVANIVQHVLLRGGLAVGVLQQFALLHYSCQRHRVG